MPSQKQKFELFARLQSLGFTYAESQTLYRAQLTLHRWDELECGDGNDYASWCIERDEESGKPFMATYPHTGKSYRRAIADKEAGALRRINAAVKARNDRQGKPSGIAESFGLSRDVIPYHQGDCRGCALYLIQANDIPTGASLDSCYNRGLAVCA